ncbi:MAG: HAD-IIIA family hydrolase [Clostridia bacterium]|nr:HAD-IIIA family hydrolase [Clostridia bacterium]
MTNKHYDIVFCDFDGTLVTTISGNTFPKGVWDMQIKFDVLDAIKKISPKYIFIVTNQGGIPQYVTKEQVEAKLTYICNAIESYMDNNVMCLYTYCSSMNKDDKFRKPNTGMLDLLLNECHITDKQYSKKDMCMIGDASGKSNQFSDSDLRCAENYGINYYDVDDFVRMCQDKYSSALVKEYTDRAFAFIDKIKNEKLTSEYIAGVRTGFIQGWIDIIEFEYRKDSIDTENLNVDKVDLLDNNVIDNYYAGVNTGYIEGENQARQFYEIYY